MTRGSGSAIRAADDAETVTQPQSAEAVRRTLEIEETTNRYFIHPVANRLARLFARLHVRPNSVSIAGMAFGVSAGFAYYHYRDVRFAIGGFALMVAWHVMDGADGQLARLTRSQSQSGKILDGVCDYVTFIAVYLALGLALSAQYGYRVWILIVLSGACHAVQSAVYEVQRQDYDFWGWGKQSAQLSELRAPPARQRIADRLHRLYARVQLVAAGLDSRSRRSLTEILERQPQRAPSIRRTYRERFAPATRHWSVMSANYRTLGIFVAALFGVPLFYFCFEIIGLSAILIVLLRRQRDRYAAFLNGIR